MHIAPRATWSAAARAAVLVAVAMLCRELFLDVAADRFGSLAPWAFLAALAVTGWLLMRPLGIDAPAWGWTGPEERGWFPGGADMVLSLFLPATFGVAYAVVVADVAPSAEPVPAAAVVSSAVLYVLAAPVVEEFFFRHLFYAETAKIFRRVTAVAVVNGVWFAAIHIPVNMPPAIVTGICCTLLRERSGSLRWPILAHALANLALEAIRY